MKKSIKIQRTESGNRTGIENALINGNPIFICLKTHSTNKDSLLLQTTNETEPFKIFGADNILEFIGYKFLPEYIGIVSVNKDRIGFIYFLQNLESQDRVYS